jgi:hypothetical protein
MASVVAPVGMPIAANGGAAPAPNAPAPAPNIIGNSFVNQYYTVLHSSPAFLYRFYNEDSTLTIAGVGHEPPSTARTQRGIHDKVMSLGGGCTVQVVNPVEFPSLWGPRVRCSCWSAPWPVASVCPIA